MFVCRFLAYVHIHIRNMYVCMYIYFGNFLEFGLCLQPSHVALISG